MEDSEYACNQSDNALFVHLHVHYMCICSPPRLLPSIDYLAYRRGRRTGSKLAAASWDPWLPAISHDLISDKHHADKQAAS